MGWVGKRRGERSARCSAVCLKSAEGLERQKDAKVKMRDAGVKRRGEEVQKMKVVVDERKKTTFCNAKDDGVTGKQSQIVKNRT